jgi:hypothetical protein
MGTIATVGTLLAASYSIATYWEVTGLADAARADSATEACASRVSATLDVVAETASWDYVPNLDYATIKDACATPDVAYSTPDTYGYVMVHGNGSAVTVQGYGECFYATEYGYATLTDSFGTVILSRAGEPA